MLDPNDKVELEMTTSFDPVIKNLPKLKLKHGSVTLQMSFIITHDSGKDLSGIIKSPKPYDPNKSYPNKILLKKEIYDWLKENIQRWYIDDRFHIYFEDEEDASAFKLRWL